MCDSRLKRLVVYYLISTIITRLLPACPSRLHGYYLGLVLDAEIANPITGLSVTLIWFPLFLFQGNLCSELYCGPSAGAFWTSASQYTYTT